MYLKKRISKKLHKKILNDVVYEISLSSLWRKRLFEDNDETEFFINCRNLCELPMFIRKQISKYKLCYFVYKEDLENEHEYKLKRFVFVATKHPMIFSDSLNNPDVI